MMTRFLHFGLLFAGLSSMAGEGVPQAVPPVPPPANPAAVTNASGAKIQFETPVYDFGKVKAGDAIKYSYVFTNIGTETLYLTNVQPSCGCTAAGEWTRKVEPGQTGKIPIQFNSANFNGLVLKTVSVTSNDREKPLQTLQLKGAVWKPIDFIPPYAVLTVPPDVPDASISIRIVNNMPEPLEIFSPEANNPAFRAVLATNQPGKEFQLTVSAVPPLNPGGIQGKVYMKTSATNMATLEVPFWTTVQPQFALLPAHVILPQAPLTSPMTPSVTIQNYSTNTLTLTDPAINAAGVGIQLKEMQAGRLYNVLLTFPAGFEIPQGQQIFLTAKTSNPKAPEIKVPVTQVQRPAVAGATQPRAQLVPAPLAPLPKPAPAR
jgi:hypothetical protein